MSKLTTKWYSQRVGCDVGVVRWGEVGTPVLRIERLTLDESGRPIDFEYLHGRGDAYQFRIRVPRW